MPKCENNILKGEKKNNLLCTLLIVRKHYFSEIYSIFLAFNYI